MPQDLHRVGDRDRGVLGEDHGERALVDLVERNILGDGLAEILRPRR